MSFGLIYLAVCRVNGKAYVGQTTKTLRHRISIHFQKGTLPGGSFFQRALRKHGLENFDFGVLAYCSTKLELNATEREWIARIGSQAPNGYNIAAGGEGSLVGRRSAAWLASLKSPAYRAAASERMRSLRASKSPEDRERWRINAARARIGKHRGSPGESNPAKRPEVREKIRLSKLGKPRPDMLGNTWAKGKTNATNSGR